jgi:hypothetical protein
LFRYLLNRDQALVRVFYVRVRGVNPLAESAPRSKRPSQVAQHQDMSQRLINRKPVD